MKKQNQKPTAFEIAYLVIEAISCNLYFDNGNQMVVGYIEGLLPLPLVGVYII